MIKIRLILLAIAPMLIGYIYNLSLLLMIPIIAQVLYYVVPILLIIYWYYVGEIYLKHIKNPFIAVLTGNSFAILSLVIYIWQFIILDDQNRSTIFAIIAQCFFAPIYILTAKIGPLFEPKPNSITQISVNVMNISALIIMVAVFVIGYMVHRRKALKGGSL